MTIPNQGPRRRKALFRNMYRNFVVWGQLIESEGPIRSIITVDGEDVSYYDLMAGYSDLPPRQKQAFTLQILQGYTERQASEVMFPNSEKKTSVQQYSSSALDRMIESYDREQNKECRNKETERKRLARKEKRDRIKESPRYEARPPEHSEEFIRNIRESLFD